MYLELRKVDGREEEEGECHVCAMPAVTVDQLQKVKGRWLVAGETLFEEDLLL